MPSDNTEGLRRRITVKCKSDFCNNLIPNVLIGTAAHPGVYCDVCRAAVRIQRNRDFYRNIERNRRRERQKQREHEQSSSDPQEPETLSPQLP